MSRLGLFDEALRSYHKVRVLVGVDEAGRGPLAGPVVAAAVVLPEPAPESLEVVRDSKLLAPKRREKLFCSIREAALELAVGWARPAEIDRYNVLEATFLAMRRAVGRLRLESPAQILVAVDGNREIPGLSLRQKALVQGDRYSLAVACAGIVAKVTRDRYMERLDLRFPGYGFAAHKGYGTARHLKALRELGPSSTHRRSFEPVSQAALPL